MKINSAISYKFSKLSVEFAVFGIKESELGKNITNFDWKDFWFRDYEDGNQFKYINVFKQICSSNIRSKIPRSIADSRLYTSIYANCNAIFTIRFHNLKSKILNLERVRENL